jgi:hypothetical protein
MTKDEALKMAIEALECIDEDLVNSAYYILVREAIPVCKEALATNNESLLVQPIEASEQEPIAWMNDIAFSMEKELLGTRSRIVGLFARPPKWKGLTKYEIIQADNATNDLHAFAYAINAKLKEKNTP